MEQIRPDTPQLENRTKVLLVDDQAFVAHAVRRLLDGLPDIDFQFCSDASQALEHANRIKPSVILQDLVMPTVDGLGLVQLTISLAIGGSPRWSAALAGLVLSVHQIISAD